MKRKTINLLLASFFLALSFSSCLGDGENIFSSGSSYAYIRDNAIGQKFATTREGFLITFPDIDRTRIGSCYPISYKINYDKVTGGLYNAEEVSLGDEIKQTQSNIVSGLTQKDDFYATSFNPSFARADSEFGDRWIFEYKATLRKGDNTWADFYYDKNNQKIDGKELALKQIVIDVVFRKIDSLDPKEDPKNESRIVASNLSRIKYEYKNVIQSEINNTTERGVLVYIKFRYKKAKGADGYEEAYVGNWESEQYGNGYGFFYPKSE